MLVPEAGWWPVLLGVLPPFLRVARDRQPYFLSRFDPWLLLFLISAGIGVWAAYNQAEAWIRFRLLLLATLFFKELSQVSVDQRPTMANALGVMGAMAALAYMGARLPAVRDAVPAWIPGGLNENAFSGSLIVFLPFAVAGIGSGTSTQDLGKAGLGLVSSALMLATVMSLGSRGAILAFASSAAFVILLVAFSQAHRKSKSHFWVLVFLLLVAAMLVIVGIVAAVGTTRLWHSITNMESMLSRVTLYREGWDLLPDFFLFGGGLGSFPGLFSRYAIGIQVPLYTHAHNFFLDLILGQGVLGVVAYLAVILMSGRKIIAALIRGGSQGWYLEGAVLLALAAPLLHGIVDDPLYASPTAFLLFLPAGVAAQIDLQSDKLVQKGRLPNKSPWSMPSAAMAWLAIATILGVGIGFAAWRPLAATVLANVGAVRMSRSELQGWPERASYAWTDKTELLAIRETFKHAINLDPGNRTAHHRLGLLDVESRQFEEAAAHLEQALARRPPHRAIRKELGLTLIWLGRYDEAASILATVPGTISELRVYSWWWGTQGRPDLAARAEQGLHALEAVSEAEKSGP